MQKYKILKTIPNTDLVEGKVVEEKNGGWFLGDFVGHPTIALLLHCNFIEVYVEKEPWDARKLKRDDMYWFVWTDGSIGHEDYLANAADKWRIATGNIFETQDAAIAYRDSVLKGKTV